VRELPAPLLALVAALLLALAGCGGDDDDGATGGGQEPQSREQTAEARERAQAAPAPAPPAAEDSAQGGAEREPPVRAAGGPRVEVLAGGLEVPWDVTFLPDGRALVTERPGRVRLVSADGRVRRAPAAVVPTQARGEGGLLGIDLDPAFARGRPFAYLYVTTARGMQVQRWRWGRGRLRRAAVVLDGVVAGSIHDSGRLRFGPDDRLYVATGDAGRGELAQRRGSLNGRFLRLTPREYRGRAEDPEVLSLGHRNPQGLDWQPGSDRLWATEHGPSGFDGPSGDDEVNVIRRGANYGWPEVRGTRHGRFAAPAWVWRRTVAPSGIAFVRRGGSAWTGDLLVAALRGRELHRLEVDGTRVTRDATLLDDRFGRLRAVVEAPDGALWVTTSNRDGYGAPVAAADDRILRIVPPRS
jgi:glucose/arabinose dehydrogenase